MTSQARPSCACRHCRCPNYAQEGDPRGLCLVCERVELWGKNSPAYRGCRCTCRCKLQVEVAPEEDDNNSDQDASPPPSPSYPRSRAHHPQHPNPLPRPLNPRTPQKQQQHHRHASACTPSSTRTVGTPRTVSNTYYQKNKHQHHDPHDFRIRSDTHSTPHYNGGGHSPSSTAAIHLLCADCAEQHRSNPRRHRPHGTSSPNRSSSRSPSPSSNNNKTPSTPTSPSARRGGTGDNNEKKNHHHRRVTSIGLSISAFSFKNIGFTPSSKAKELKQRPCLTPYARKRYNMITG